MIPDDEHVQLRSALTTLLDAEPPMRSSVADDVRRGRALRMRRQRWYAGAAAAVVVLGVAGLVGLPHLAGGTDQTPVARPAATSGVDRSSPAAGWEIPVPVPGELGRVELPDGPASLTIEPVDGLAYATALSCRSADPTARVVVDVWRANSLVESTEALCDGTPVRNGGGTYFPEGGPLTLTVAAPAGAQAYAVVAPSRLGPEPSASAASSGPSSEPAGRRLDAALARSFVAFEAQAAALGWRLDTPEIRARQGLPVSGLDRGYVLMRGQTGFRLDVSVRPGSARAGGVAGACRDIGVEDCSFGADGGPIESASPANADVDERKLELAYPSGTSVILVAHRPYVRASLRIGSDPVPVSNDELRLLAAALGDPDAR